MTEKSLSYHKIDMVIIVHMFAARKILATNVIDTSGDTPCMLGVSFVAYTCTNTH